MKSNEYPIRETSTPDDTGEVVITECFINGRWVELPDGEILDGIIKILQTDYDGVVRHLDSLRSAASNLIHSRELAARSEVAITKWLTDKLIAELKND